MRKYEITNVPAIEEFLQAWASRARVYIATQAAAYLKESGDLSAVRKGQDDYIRQSYRKVPEMDEEQKANFDAYRVMARNQYAKDRKYLNEKYTQVIQKYALGDLDLEKHLDREVQKRREDLFARCAAVIGNITDASNLQMGADASINGLVIGDEGRAWVSTIYAGGYNIQCLHYRVLVKKQK